MEGAVVDAAQGSAGELVRAEDVDDDGVRDVSSSSSNIANLVEWISEVARLPLSAQGDEVKEMALVSKICLVLDEYQDQPYLLDPSLEPLVQPLIAALRSYVQSNPITLSLPRVSRISRLVYFFTKVRGSKTVLKLFPHAVTDLTVLLAVFKTDPDANWETRYILLLWLSLVVMLPFALSTQTNDIVEIGTSYLSSASKEREGAVSLLARWFSRQDADITGLLEKCKKTLAEADPPILLDSTSRYSSAKYLARLASNLPNEMATELLKEVCAPLQSSTAATTNESAFHGACLSIAELARRNLIPHDEEILELVLGCVRTALTFDRLILTHAVGSSVRDAAAYALWSLARSLPPCLLHGPRGNEIAQALVGQTLFDREVHVRRAGSAAFQECVGRWGAFENGIELLTPLSSSNVGARTKAFLVAAPSVAHFVAYRSGLIRHLVEVTLVHYDPDMRALAADALGRIIQVLLEEEAQDGAIAADALIAEQIGRLAVTDIARRHGAFLALASLARTGLSRPSVEKIFRAVAAFPAPRSPLVLAAQLDAIASSCIAVEPAPAWFPYVEAALRPHLTTVHPLAAKAFASATRQFDCSSQIDALLKGKMEAAQVLILSGAEYGTLNGASLRRVVNALMSRGRTGSIEAKRNSIEGLTKLVHRYATILGKDIVDAVLDAMLDAFSDYTIDQRGDVGSWVRQEAIAGVERCAALLVEDQERLDRGLASLMKQSVERLDGVRRGAGLALSYFASLSPRPSGLRGGTALWDTLRDPDSPRDPDSSEWRSFSWTAPRILPFLAVPEYRLLLLEGVLHGVTLHTTATTFLDFATRLPETANNDDELDLAQLVDDISTLAKRNFSANRLFVPCLTTLGLLLESGVLDNLEYELLRQVLLVSTKSIGQMKSWPRLMASSKVATGLLGLPSTSALAAAKMEPFLRHPMPTVRQRAAEEILAVVVAWEDADTLQTILAETPWLEGVDDEAVERCIEELTSLAKEELL